MENELDLSGAVNMLQEMLGSEDGKEQIQNIMSALGGAKAETPADTTPNFGADNIEMMLKIQKIMTLMNSNNRSREAAFLQSLGPLLRPERRGTIDSAMKFLTMGHAIKAFQELDGV